MGYSMKPGSKEKNTPSNFNENDAKKLSKSPAFQDRSKKKVQKKGPQRVGKDFKFPEADMKAEISASSETVYRGGGAPTPGSANVDKVVERVSKRKFGQHDPYLSPKEKKGKKGAKWAKSRKFSKQSVKFN